MWQQLIETVGADIARLTPNTPPAVWLVWGGYALTAVGALLIAAATVATTRSRLVSAAVSIAFLANSARHADPFGLLLVALVLFGVVNAWKITPTFPRWAMPTLLLVGLLFRDRGGLLVWGFAALGLSAIGDHISTGRGPAGRHLRTLAIVTLTLIMVTARIPAAATSAPPPVRPLGYDRVTLTSFRALVSNLPSGSWLVNDGRVTGILLRAVAKDLSRAHVEIHSAGAEAASVRDAISAGNRVFALPHAQQTLAMHGFQIVDSLRTADRGLAEITVGGRCVEATHWWQDAPSFAGAANLAFAARDDEERGPVVIYLMGAEPIRIEPIDWPSRTLRGFAPRTFDLTNAQDRQDFEQQRTEDRGPWTEDLSVKSLTRLAVWRTPDAAREMMIRLSAPATRAAVQLAPEAKRDVSVCPAFPATVSAIR
jgi:hypothetical protein